MTRYQTIRRAMALLIAAVFLMTSLALPATQTGMIGTYEYVSAEEVETQRQDIMNLLEREDVREQLVAWGVDPAEAEQRVGSLTAAEVQQLHQRMDEMPAGAGVGTVVGAIVLIFLILLITDLLGWTDAFPFVHSQAR